MFITILLLFLPPENHRTQTQYETMLITKIFLFQFVNSYTSLYYVAFFKNGAKLWGQDSLQVRDSLFHFSCTHHSIYLITQSRGAHKLLNLAVHKLLNLAAPITQSRCTDYSISLCAQITQSIDLYLSLSLFYF